MVNLNQFHEYILSKLTNYSTSCNLTLASLNEAGNTRLLYLLVTLPEK